MHARAVRFVHAKIDIFLAGLWFFRWPMICTISGGFRFNMQRCRIKFCSSVAAPLGYGAIVAGISVDSHLVFPPNLLLLKGLRGRILKVKS